MATMKQRIIAASGAIVFFLSTIALSVIVVVSLVQESKQKNDAEQTASTGCEAPAQAETLAVPEPFTAEASVAELQKTDLQEGDGQAAVAGDCLIMKYYGTLASNGELFDENFTRPTAFAFTLGQGQVIQGWDQGLVGMKEGGTRRLVIPAALAYGGQSPSEKIPANSDLVFVVKLVGIKE